MATEVKAPGDYNKLAHPIVFLGGAIDQGKAPTGRLRSSRP